MYMNPLAILGNIQNAAWDLWQGKMDEDFSELGKMHQVRKKGQMNTSVIRNRMCSDPEA